MQKLSLLTFDDRHSSNRSQQNKPHRGALLTESRAPIVITFIHLRCIRGRDLIFPPFFFLAACRCVSVCVCVWVYVCSKMRRSNADISTGTGAKGKHQWSLDGEFCWRCRKLQGTAVRRRRRCSCWFGNRLRSSELGCATRMRLSVSQRVAVL